MYVLSKEICNLTRTVRRSNEKLNKGVPRKRANAVEIREGISRSNKTLQYMTQPTLETCTLMRYNIIITLSP